MEEETRILFRVRFLDCEDKAMTMKTVRVLAVITLLTGICFAACPASVTCPQDGATMYPDGQIKYEAGVEFHEYAHTVWGPYDPTKPPARHTQWVECKTN